MSDTFDFFLFKYNVENAELNVIHIEQNSIDNVTFDTAFYTSGMYIVCLRENKPLVAIKYIKDNITNTIASLRKIEQQINKLQEVE